MEVREPDPILCEAVDMGGFDLASERANIGVSQVVSHDDEEIRARLPPGRFGHC